MKRTQSRPSPAVRVAAILLLTAAAAGCTLLGFGIGSAIDSGKYDAEVAGWQFQEVKPGTELELNLKNGASVEGT